LIIVNLINTPYY